MLELTPTGWLSLLGLLAGLVAGGTPQLNGFRAGAYLPFDGKSAEVYFTPVTQVTMPSNTLSDLGVGGVTLGGTMLLDIQDKTYLNDVLQYEYGHIRGYDHFGLAYPLYAIGQWETYDPRYNWSGGKSDFFAPRPATDLPMQTGALRLLLGEP